MNPLTIILNRVFWFLTKVKNQSPLLGASILVSILIGVFLRNVVLLIYVFKKHPLKTYNWLDYTIFLLIFLLTYFYARKKKGEIMNNALWSSKGNNLFVVFLYLFIVFSFIFLAKVNRDKIFTETKKEQSDLPRKESLENKIRKSFE